MAGDALQTLHLGPRATLVLSVGKVEGAPDRKVLGGVDGELHLGERLQRHGAPERKARPRQSDPAGGDQLRRPCDCHFPRQVVVRIPDGRRGESGPEPVEGVVRVLVAVQPRNDGCPILAQYGVFGNEERPPAKRPSRMRTSHSMFGGRGEAGRCDGGTCRGGRRHDVPTDEGEKRQDDSLENEWIRCGEY